MKVLSVLNVETCAGIRILACATTLTQKKKRQTVNFRLYYATKICNQKRLNLHWQKIYLDSRLGYTRHKVQNFLFQA